MSLEIVNGKYTEVTDCEGILLSVEYIKAGGKPIHIIREINPNGFPLTWGGESELWKVTKPRDDGQRLLNIAKYVAAKLAFIFTRFKWLDYAIPSPAKLLRCASWH